MADYDLPNAVAVRRAPVTGEIAGEARLDYEGRFLRRRRLVTEDGRSFLADLPETASLDDGDALELADGRLIRVRAADEPLLSVRGDLPRLAWHIGNRHAPCRIEADRLLIREDMVLAHMLKGLGATVEKTTAPFAPERGAYGVGRTLPHSHGPHDHAHDHAQGAHDHHHQDGCGHDHGHSRD